MQGQGKSGSVASNYLAAAEERYNMAQKSYEGAQERYLKASDSLKDTQLQIAAIMGDLAMLDAKKISMASIYIPLDAHDLTNELLQETIKRILVKCMHTLASLKTEVSNLARFFLAVGKLIDYVTDTQVLEFIKYLETLGTAGDGPSIAGFTFTDFRRQVGHLIIDKLLIVAYSNESDDFHLCGHDSMLLHYISWSWNDVHHGFTTVHLPRPEAARRIELRSFFGQCPRRFEPEAHQS